MHDAGSVRCVKTVFPAGHRPRPRGYEAQFPGLLARDLRSNTAPGVGNRTV